MINRKMVEQFLKTYADTKEHEEMRQEVFVILENAENKEEAVTLIMKKIVEVSFNAVHSTLNKLLELNGGESGEEWKGAGLGDPNDY